MTEKTSSKELEKKLLSNSVFSSLNNLHTFFEQNITKLLSERSFYGETFLAAALSKQKKSRDIQEKLLDSFFEKNFSFPTHHPEFNLYALQHYEGNYLEEKRKNYLQNMDFELPFYRKVSNWVLLRSLVQLKTKSKKKIFVANIQMKLILMVNVVDGYITDNTLRSVHKKKKSISDQYHAFATMLIGEIYLETKKQKHKKLFLKYLNKLIPKIDENGEALKEGRGKKQIFGYASLIYALTLAYSFTQDVFYLEKAEKVLQFVMSFQKQDGSIPLVLTHNNPSQYWLSYNNFFDYEGFLYFYLLKTYELIA